VNAGRRSGSHLDNLRVSGCLESTETSSYDKHGSTESPERLLDSGRPEKKASNTKCEETSDERDSESISTANPTRDGERAEEVGTKVSCGKTRTLSSRDVQEGLEIGVEDIEKTVGKTPEKEKTSHQGITSVAVSLRLLRDVNIKGEAR
jgi:hypothetical protein